MAAATIADSINPLAQGFLLCASIIIAVGPQNLFILRQGLQRQHLFAIALVSTLADVVLISIGVGGLSSLISASGIFQTIITVGGVLFLVTCGARALLKASQRRLVSPDTTPNTATTGMMAILTALSFSLLNPAAYLDTLVIIGSKSLLFPDEQRLIFGIGAVLSSTFWFFSLAYGASKLAPIFRSQVAWRTLDFVSGIIMLGMALTMIGTTHLMA